MAFGNAVVGSRSRNMSSFSQSSSCTSVCTADSEFDVASNCSVEVTEADFLYESSLGSTFTISCEEARGVTDILDVVKQQKKGRQLNHRSIKTIVSIMWENVHHARTQLAGCQVLQQLALDRDNRPSILKADAVSAIHFAMLHHTDHPAIQECACWAISLLCKSHLAASASVSWETIIGSILVALDAHADHVGIQQHGLEALVRLANNYSLLEALLESGGMKVIESSLTTHKRFRPVVAIVFELLYLVTSQDASAAADFIDVIVEAMNGIPPDHQWVQAQGVRILASLAMVEFGSTNLQLKAVFEKVLDDGSHQAQATMFHEIVGDCSNNLDDQLFSIMNDRNKHPYIQKIVSLVPKSTLQGTEERSICANIASARAIGPVVTAMNSNAEHPSIQMNGCIVLAALAVNAAKSYDICEAGGHAAILKAMTKHVDDAGVQKNGCVALAGIWACVAIVNTNGNSMDETPTAMDTDNECVDVILAALENHKNDIEIQVIGCRALHYYIIHIQKQGDGSIRSVPSCNMIVAAMVSTMKRCKEESDVQELGSNVLASVALGCKEEGLTTEGDESQSGLELLVDLMGNLKLGSSAKAGCCMTMLNISANRKSRSGLVRLGAVGALIRLMQTQKDHVKILELAALILHNVCLSSSLGPAVVAGGAIPALFQVMTHHRARPSLQASCCDALWAIATSDLQHAYEIGSSGGCELVSMAMKEHTKSMRIQSRGCMLLATCADCMGDKAFVASPAPIIAAMINSAGNLQVVAYGLRLLARLVSRKQAGTEEAVHAVCLAVKALKGNAIVQVFGSSCLAGCHYSKRPVAEIFASAVSTMNEYSVGLIKLFCDLGTIMAINGDTLYGLKLPLVEEIISAMKCHIGNASVQASGCCVLHRISRSNVGPWNLPTAKVVEIVTLAMKQHLENVPIQGLALKTFMNILGTSETVPLQFVGVASVVAQVMAFHKKEKELQRVGCFVLSKLSQRPCLKGMKKIIDSVTSTMQDNQGHAMIQKYGRRSLENLQQQETLPVVVKPKCVPHEEIIVLGWYERLALAFTASIFLDILSAFFVLWILWGYWRHLVEPLDGYFVVRY